MVESDNEESVFPLAQLAQYIEHILDRPKMYSKNAYGLETGLFIAFSSWLIITESSHNLNKLWRAEVKLAYPNFTEYSAVSLSTPPVGWWKMNNNFNPEFRDRILIPVIVNGMRNIWSIIKNTNGNLHN